MPSFASRLAAAFTYPRSIDDYVELACPLYSEHEVRARVVLARRETHDVVTLRLAPSSRLRPHRAGQHVALTVPIHGVRRTRLFSVASAECQNGRTLELTIKASAGGAVTPTLVAHPPVGSIVSLSQPSGDFVLPDPVPERLVLLSGGSGITPVMSMLRTLLERGHAGRVVFAHYARSKADTIYQSELERIACDAEKNYRVILETGLFSAADLDAIAPDWARSETYACGPLPMIEKVERAYSERGAEAHLHIERFALSVPADSGTAGEGGRVTFSRSRRHAIGGGSLLALAESAGLSPKSGCRMGICRSCVCRKRSGVTRNVRSGQISSDADVDIQLCVHEAIGPVDIDL